MLDLLVLCNCLDTDTERGAQAFVSRLSNTSAAFPNVGVDFGASSNKAKKEKGMKACIRGEGYSLRSPRQLE